MGFHALVAFQWLKVINSKVLLLLEEIFSFGRLISKWNNRRFLVFHLILLRSILIYCWERLFKHLIKRVLLYCGERLFTKSFVVITPTLSWFLFAEKRWMIEHLILDHFLTIKINYNNRSMFTMESKEMSKFPFTN